MTAEIIYKGALRTEAKHVQSDTIIHTDAPTDNQGMGANFSPTDLVATALGSCMLTIMGIKARDMQVDIAETVVEIEKIMVTDPRRIGGINVNFNFPKSLTLDTKTTIILENAAHTCPVIKSIHPDIAVKVTFNWHQ